MCIPTLLPVKSPLHAYGVAYREGCVSQAPGWLSRGNIDTPAILGGNKEVSKSVEIRPISTSASGSNMSGQMHALLPRTGLIYGRCDRHPSCMIHALYLIPLSTSVHRYRHSSLCVYCPTLYTCVVSYREGCALSACIGPRCVHVCEMSHRREGLESPSCKHRHFSV
jgi:hypothetical protein